MHNELRASCVCLAASLLLVLPAIASAQQNNMAVVQLPTFSFFSVATTVSVPDRGGAYLGGVGQAQSGRTRFGSPLFPSQGALGSSRSVGGISITAEIHDLREMDRALLGSSNEPLVRGETSRRLADAQPVGAAGVEHVADLRRQAAAAQQDEATAFLERGKVAEAEGKHSVAKIHYQMAARRASGALKEESQACLDRLAERLARAPQPAAK